VPKHRYPETAVFYRRLTRTYPLIVKGEGCYLYDADGQRYLDACGGAFVANLGHGVPSIGEAMARQAAAVAYVNGTAFSNEPVERLAAEIARRSPGDLNRVYFLASGSEAVEAALKLARQYWVEAGRVSKQRIVALAPAYHGNTLLALSASARAHYKRLFASWLVEVIRIPAPYAYRCACGGRPPHCPACSGAALEEAILRAGPDTVAAFVGEPIGGSSTGASVPPPDYWRRVREICTRHGVLFIADEVLTGVGRTGTWSALEPFGVVPDLMTLGKGLTGGYAPLSALVAPTRIVDVLAAGSGSLMHAQTFSHHAVLCAAGLATLERLEADHLIERCARLGQFLQEELATLLDHPAVGDVRGRGLLAGVELVADRATRAPFPRDRRLAEQFVEAALQLGLVVWPNVGHADGTNGDLLCLAPPFIITEAEIREAVRLFKEALEVSLAALPPGGRR
jgi:adenosylmethionine-8-amino-7-oxononanoate aminotransferase